MINKPELLAPAGDLERLKIALLYGADAVYCGGPSFGLRANAINFTFEELKEGVAFAHSLNKKVYVTVNIVLHNKEGKELLDYLKNIEETKCDAIIVSDPYIVDFALKNTNLHVHLSTQQSTMNYESCKFFYEQGVERIVLARECTKEDIKSIIEFAHKNNILVVVDAAQSLGHTLVDVKDMDIDFLAGSAHKMCGPMGVGILYAKEELMREVKPVYTGGGVTVSFNEDEIVNFIEKIEKEFPSANYVCELKIDGRAVSIKYENG